MANLGLQLRETIWNLEELRDRQNPPSADLIAQIDALYDQLIDLVNGNVNSASKEYEKAAKAMEEAATRTRKAVKGLARAEDTLESVAKAIEKVAALLAGLAGL